jgi:hypothetical protein
MLDHSIYTHEQLKTAYLERIHELHPDKRRNEMPVNGDKTTDHASAQFILIKEAWSRYEEFARALTKVNNGSQGADFTLFGVGCSFSDTEEERQMRNEITDQACRGWFSAGELSTGDDTSGEKQKMKSQSSLLDDNMFTIQDDEGKMSPPSPPTGKRKSLVDQIVRPSRR